MGKAIVRCCICGTHYVSSQAGFCPYCVIESLQQELARSKEKLCAAEAELSAYKQGVEVEGKFGGYNSIHIGTKSNTKLLGQFEVGQRVKVLVRAKEEVCK